MTTNETLVYEKGGDECLGMTARPEHELISEAKERGATVMYKGYRYYDNKRDSVIVFDKQAWDRGEKARRKANGFLGIRETLIG